MNGINHRMVQVSGLQMHIAEQGEGPLVLLCHGFPESWYSWRHQLGALAEAGFHAVAPDMRGYGDTERPAEIDKYTMLHLVGDMVGLLDALGAESAVVAGHDWGAPVAWNAAALRPDRFRAVVAMSVPYRPRSPEFVTKLMPQTDEALFYVLYFQKPGIAEAELERDVRHSIRSLLSAAGGEAGPRGAGSATPDPFGMVQRKSGLLGLLPNPTTLPAWLGEADVDFYSQQYIKSGFRGGLNWYRNIDRNWELLACLAGSKITVPALYLAGDRDIVLGFPGMKELISGLSNHVPRLRETIILEGCGHWTQQERPEQVNSAMISFLRGL